MNKISQIISFLEGKYPQSKAEDWDNVGLQFGNKNKKIENVLVALDLTTEVFEQVLQDSIDLVITHHPFMWERTETENIENAPYKKSLITRIKNINLNLYALHTNYDAGKDGTPYQVAKQLGWDKTTRIKGSDHGIIAEVDNLNLQQVKDVLWDKFNLQFSTNYSEENKRYNKIAIFPGSGAIKDMCLAHEQGAELIITSDVKWSDWITIKEQKMDVLAVSHGMEDIFVTHVHELLKKKFPKLNVTKMHTSEINEY